MTTENMPAVLIDIDVTPAVIVFDFDAAKQTLEAEMEKFNILVTEETLADSKKLATDLNKRAAGLDDLRKKAIAKASAPIKERDTQLKELVQLYKESRQKLVDQVAEFEDKVKQVAHDLLKNLRAELWDSQSVSDEFQSAQFDDLVKLGALTKKQALTAATINELTNRVSRDKQHQDKVKMRLLQLNNESMKVGLAAPLTKEHVAHFLNDDDASYELKLSDLVDRELDRQVFAEDALRKKIEAEEDAKREDMRTENFGNQSYQVGQAVAPAMAPPPVFATAKVRKAITFGLLFSPSMSEDSESYENALMVALKGSASQPWGIWSAGVLVTIVYQSVAFNS